MEQSTFTGFTRRDFLVASCGILVCKNGWAMGDRQPVLNWALDREASAGAESVTGSMATIIDGTGRLFWVADSDTRLLRLDGYSIWLEHVFEKPIVLGRELSLSAWLALESFPVSTASIVEWGTESSGVQLAVDRLGYVLATIRHNGVEETCHSPLPLERGRWSNVAFTRGDEGAGKLYIDGKTEGQAKILPGLTHLAPINKVFLGRAAKSEPLAKIFQPNVLNGLMRQVRIYDCELPSSEIALLSEEYQRTPAALASESSWFTGDDQRPLYHAMPPRAWTNEPHGLVKWRGEYHLFYQKNANGPYWGHIHWGHMTSPDLLQWTERPMALIPEQGVDSEGCWSGSAIVVNDKIVLIYTGGNGKRASICMASTDDGIHFTKYSGNPIIEAPPSNIGVKEFRDPFIWKEDSEYRMIIGSGVTDVGGTALLYRSTNLTSWEYLKPLLIGDKQSSGVFWEMPVFVKLGSHRVLIVCEVPGRASYWAGDWKNDEFHPLITTPRRLDLFNHFLSPTPYVDENGRVLTIGIVPESRPSFSQWQAGWAHLYGIPRELSLDNELQLAQRPISELAARFTPSLAVTRRQPLDLTWTVLPTTGACVAMEAHFEQGSSQAVAIGIRRSPNREEETIIRYQWQDAHLVLDRSKASCGAVVRQEVQEVSYLPSDPATIKVTIFIDRSVVEVFVDDRACFATRVYPILAESVGLAMCAEGGIAYVKTLRVSNFVAT